MSIRQIDSLPKTSEKRSTTHEKKQKLASQQPLLKVFEISPINDEEIPVVVSNSDNTIETELRTPRTPLEVNSAVCVAKSLSLLGFFPENISSACCS